MPTGVTRILPCAVISAALHAVVLMSAHERLEIAVTRGGDTGPVAVRLVPAGPTTPDPAAQSGVAGSTPEPSRSGDGQPEPTATTAEATSPDKTTAGESSGSAEPESTEPDRVPAASAERNTTEAAPTEADQPRADAAATDRKEQPDASGTASDSTQESTEAVAAAETGTSDAPGTPEKPKTAETTDTPEPARAEDASGKTTEDDRQTDEQSGADGADDRAQLASRAREQVRIHFRDRFRYPRIARQRGWEGRVVLTFRLQPDGRITDVEVTESSGRSILDENARQTLIHIQRVPELADLMGQESLELEVPVTYRLQPA